MNDDERRQMQADAQDYAHAGAEIRRLGEKMAAQRAFWWAARAAGWIGIDDREIEIMWKRYLAEEEEKADGDRQ